MPRIKYQDWEPGDKALATIQQANKIIVDYQRQGYDLTLRQLYYQFVSRDLIPNRVQEYKRLGDVISQGRRAGLIDWRAIVDRTRNLRSSPSWETPADYIMPNGFAVDMWEGQPRRVEVWIEKDALLGVFERACREWRVPYFSCRGYTSDSEIWGAARRLVGYAHDDDAEPVILHFGDHDPSGIDMTRDIRDRIELLGGPDMEVRRLALNMPQVEQYQPPPNPAKETDSRYAGYIAEYGTESWELDALEPTVLAELVSREVSGLIDKEKWNERKEEEAEGQRLLNAVTDRWDEVVALLKGAA